MIDIEGTAPLPPARLPDLVTAVHSAQPEDECDWLEWKSALDLNSRHGQFVLARSILGFANRDPKTATHPLGGTAYVVVGAEPGHIEGVTPIDLADLQPRLAHYLGAPAPFWRHHYVSPREDPDRVVLVIEVPAPRVGDIAYPLAHEGTAGPKKPTAPSGTLFIRRGSKTERADYAEVHMLLSRAVESARPTTINDLGLKLSVIPDHILIALDLEDAAIDGWLERRRQVLLAQVPDTVRRNAAIGRAWASRAIGETSQAIDAYLEDVRPYVRGLMTAAFLTQGYNGVVIHVDNPSDEHLADIDVTLTLPHKCLVIDPSKIERAILPRYPGESPQPALTSNLSFLRPDGPRQAHVGASPRCTSDGTKTTHVEPIGAIPAQSGGHTCTIQLHLQPGPATLDFEVAVRSKSLPGVARWQTSAPVETKNGTFLDELVDPDPTTSARPRKYRPTHRHQHG